MKSIENLFSWSMSRAEKFRTCPRAYYYHYYGSFGGWERGAPAKTRELWLLKKLTSRKAWAGSSVHETIAWALQVASQGSSLPSLEEATSRMHKNMRIGFMDSRAGHWKTRRTLGLLEHAYNEPVSDREWKDNWEHARRSLTNFYNSSVSKEILAVSSNSWFPIDSLDHFILENLDNLKVYVAPDFAFTNQAGLLRILDWKTGQPKDSDQKQVLGYFLFAMKKWGADHSTAIGELHYLADGDVVEVTGTPQSIDHFSQEMRASVEQMQTRLFDKNKNIALESDFEALPHPGKCRYCNFRGPCEYSKADAF